MRTEKRPTQRILPILLLFSIVIATSMAALGQAGRGGISGLITDGTGAVVPGATVTLTDIATGAKLTTVSTGAGLYSFVSLAPGSYEVTASAKGFDTVVQKNVET